MFNMFELGQIVITRGINLLMSKDQSFNQFLSGVLYLYGCCYWGDTCPEDKISNDEAVKAGNLRIHSVYIYPKLNKEIWIITEADRSVTTILLPEEY